MHNVQRRSITMQNEIAESRSQVRTLKRIVCLACSFGSVLLLSGCHPFKVVAEVVTAPIKIIHNAMYTELEQEDMRRAEIRARGIELENVKREEDARLGRPVNPPPWWVEPELE